MKNPRQILVTPPWLDKHRQDADLIILDTTVAIPGAAPVSPDSKRMIPGALRFDIDGEFSDVTAPFPHTMLSPDLFSKKARALGINKNSRIVVYDDNGVFSAPRAWWMFYAMGHDNILILNGGLPAWQAAGLPCEKNYGQTVAAGNFQAEPNAGCFVDKAMVEKAITDNSATIIDARSADRFHGRVDEPRPGLRRGNIPRSLNLPFGALIENGAYRSPDLLAENFNGLNINKNQPLYFSCGSGVTACIDAVAAVICGYQEVGVYDGSWTEWATLQP